jgi:hypothetical protein
MGNGKREATARTQLPRRSATSDRLRAEGSTPADGGLFWAFDGVVVKARRLCVPDPRTNDGDDDTQQLLASAAQ